MKKVLFILTTLLALCVTKLKAQDCLMADMMIIVDWSGSEQGHEIEVATAAALFVSELPVQENTLRVGVIAFSDEIDTTFSLTGDKEKIMNDIVVLSEYGAGGGTYINKALNESGRQLLNTRMVPKIIIIISDGEISDIEESSMTAFRLKSMMSVTIFAVQIGRDEVKGDIEYLIKLTGSPDNVEVAVPTGILEALKKLNICG